MKHIHQDKCQGNDDPIWRNQPDKPSSGPFLPGEGALFKVRYRQTTPAEDKKQMDEGSCYCMDESSKFGILIRHEEKPVMYHDRHDGHAPHHIHPGKLPGVIGNSCFHFKHYHRSKTAR